jgi:hypothetical protein
MKNIEAKNRLRGHPRAIFLKPKFSSFSKKKLKVMLSMPWIFNDLRTFCIRRNL